MFLFQHLRRFYLFDSCLNNQLSNLEMLITRKVILYTRMSDDKSNEIYLQTLYVRAARILRNFVSCAISTIIPMSRLS